MLIPKKEGAAGGGVRARTCTGEAGKVAAERGLDEEKRFLLFEAARGAAETMNDPWASKRKEEKKRKM